jgi:type VI secretion system protein VasI
MRLSIMLPSLALALSMTVPVSAIENKEVAACAAISGGLDRLACYDKLAAANALDKPASKPVPADGVGKWQVSRTKNPVDDSETVVLLLTADKGQSTWGKPILFIARCRSNATEAYINWNDYLGSDSHDVYSDWKYVTIRIGDDKAKEERWGLSTDSEATFAPDWAGDLLKEMAQTDHFLAQITPYNESPITAQFDTTGLANALKPLAEVCHWPTGA